MIQKAREEELRKEQQLREEDVQREQQLREEQQKLREEAQQRATEYSKKICVYKVLEQRREDRKNMNFFERYIYDENQTFKNGDRVKFCDPSNENQFFPATVISAGEAHNHTIHVDGRKEVQLVEQRFLIKLAKK